MLAALFVWWVGLLLVVGGLLALLAWWLHYRYWLRRLSLQMEYASVEELAMPDGGAIELRRVALPDEAGPSHPPVLLVHGIAANHRNNDAAPDYSFARFLHKSGRDVWLVTMRSGRRSRYTLAARRQSIFKSMVQHDLPQAVDAVLARTGAPQLDIGVFSMGGMVLYASLGRSLHPARVHRVLVMASPAVLRPLGPLGFWVRYWPVELTPTLPLRLMMRTLAFAGGLTPPFVARYFYNKPNVPPAVLQASMVDMLEDIPGALGAELMRWGATGGDIRVDGERALDGLASVTVPACFFAGSVDWLAPVHAVRIGYEAWGRDVGCHKHFLVLGRATGAREEYGHADIAFGAHAREDVFEPALRFLDTGDPHAVTERSARLSPDAGVFEGEAPLL